MNNLQRRFEILLPRQFNDGQPIPDDLFAETLLELRQQFGAVSSETQFIQGVWEFQGQSYRDDLIRIFVDVADTLDKQAFFRDLKERLKDRFRQDRDSYHDLSHRSLLKLASQKCSGR